MPRDPRGTKELFGHGRRGGGRGGIRVSIASAGREGDEKVRQQNQDELSDMVNSPMESRCPT